MRVGVWAYERMGVWVYGCGRYGEVRKKFEPVGVIHSKNIFFERKFEPVGSIEAN